MNNLNDYKGINDIFEIDGGADIRIIGSIYIDRESNISSYHAPVYIRIHKNARLEIEGKFTILPSMDLVIYQDAVLKIGDGTYINSDSEIRCKKSITIGRNCAIGRRCNIMDSDFHELDGKERIESIDIGNHVWIGNDVTILKGVSIGNNCVIGAKSVVTHSISQGCVAAGNPAIIIRKCSDWR